PLIYRNFPFFLFWNVFLFIANLVFEISLFYVRRLRIDRQEIEDFSIFQASFFQKNRIGEVTFLILF
ncbi:hypothetical protein, partial [Mycoplasmoides pneumoniae]|uniref:hypothetical protein n=1 Tax=Mycoplasmoides pneumoniae TaxID=2104 RepID=UPI001F285AE8